MLSCHHQFSNFPLPLPSVSRPFLPGSGHQSDFDFCPHLHQTRLDPALRLLDLGQPPPTPGMARCRIHHHQQLVGGIRELKQKLRQFNPVRTFSSFPANGLRGDP